MVESPRRGKCIKEGGNVLRCFHPRGKSSKYNLRARRTPVCVARHLRSVGREFCVEVLAATDEGGDASHTSLPWFGHCSSERILRRPHTLHNLCKVGSSIMMIIFRLSAVLKNGQNSSHWRRQQRICLIWSRSRLASMVYACPTFSFPSLFSIAYFFSFFVFEPFK